MSPTNTRIARTAAGAACIIAIIAAFGWFAFQFVPGTPRSPEPKTDGSITSIAGTGNISYVAENVVDISFGKSFVTESITRGKWFSTSEEERAAWSDEESERYLASGSYLIESSGIEITAHGLKAVTLDAFAEWYPHYTQTLGYTQAHEHECKVLLTDITLTNTADYAQQLPVFQLWSEEANGASNVLDQGIGGDSGYLIQELYGVDSGRGLVQYKIPEEWFTLEAGETRTLTIPCLIYQSAFRDPEAYENIDPSKFCLALSDYDPPTIYRFWLG